MSAGNWFPKYTCALLSKQRKKSQLLFRQYKNSILPFAEYLNSGTPNFMSKIPVPILLILCVCLAGDLFSQTFSAVPGPVLHKEVQFEQANECYIYFNNPSGDSLSLRWRLIESNLPEEWDADLCDYGLCYIGIPSNGLMSTVYDTIQPYLKLVVQPGTSPGSAWIWFRVFENGNQDNFVDVFYSLYTPGTLSTAEIQDEPLLAYPNPVHGELTLENRQSIPGYARLIHPSGKVCWQGELPPHSQQKQQISDWPPGLYVLQNGIHSQKILLLK